MKKEIILIGLILILISVASLGYTHIYFTTYTIFNWDEDVFTREAIHNYDIVIKWLEEGKYEEAAILSGATNTYLWYLRNAKDTQFYDELHDKTDYVFFDSHIKWYKDNPDKIAQIIENIKTVQVALCPKSDMTYEWGLQCSYECSGCSNCFDFVRCHQNGTQINGSVT
jgi:hypothetical protein